MTDQKSAPDRGARSGWAFVAAWLAAAVGLPSAWAAINRREVAAHPLLGLALLAFAVTAATVGSLVSGLWRTKYYDRVIDWMSAELDRRLSRFGRRYHEYILSDLRFVDLRGLVGRAFDPELSAVYVDVALRPRDAGKVPSSDLAPDQAVDLPTAGKRSLIGDFLGKPRPRVLAVIGAPGSGKTTLLRHTARDLYTHSRRPRRQRNTPVLLYLRDHVTAITADPQVALPTLVTSILARYGLTEPREWLERRLRAGKCLVLLDGLDEVAEEADRKAISDWVTVQVTRYPDNDFVVTSRPLGYQSAPIDGAITVQTQPFTPEQVTHFVHAWYLAENRHDTGADDPGVTRQARAEADDLLAQLRKVPALHTLTVNPLLLTMIAIVHRHHGALPGSRADLYAQICQVLLWRRQDAKKLRIQPRGDQKERLMRVLAFEMMSRGVRDLATDEAVAILQPWLRRIAKDLTAEEFIDDAALNGLFIEREPGVRAFAHQTFQEYLAAAHIKDKNLQDVLIHAVNDIWWRETILLYVAGTDAGPIVEASLAANTIPALTLALDCEEEAGELHEELRQKLEDLLAAGFARGADPERRKLLIAVTVGRQLREVTEAGSGTRLCTRAITNRVYRLFLEDIAARGQHRPPDAPTDRLADPDDVVTGVRGSDVTALKDWVNEIGDGTRAYRLPVRAEINDALVSDALAGQLSQVSTWVVPSDTENLPQLYIPTSAPNPLAINATTVRSHLIRDLAAAPLTLGLLPLIITAKVAVRILTTHGIGSTDVLHLDRALNRASSLVLEHASERELELADALGLIGDPDSTASIDRDLGGTLDGGTPFLFELPSVRELELADALGLISDPGSTAIVDRNLNRALVRDLDVSRDTDHDLGGTLDLATAAARALNPDNPDNNLVNILEQASESARAIHSDLADGDALDLARDLARVLAYTSGTEIFLGRALSQMLTQRIRSLPSTSGRGNRFTDLPPLTFPAMDDSAHYLLSPDSLADDARAAIAALRKRSVDSELPSALWARRATDRFEILVGPVLAREQPVEASAAPALRILALCLAAEADILESPDLRDTFSMIAATITWLERRNSGDEKPADTIVLALDDKI